MITATALWTKPEADRERPSLFGTACRAGKNGGIEMALHVGDIVEVIATKRRGTIDFICMTGTKRKPKPYYWRVIFLEGTTMKFAMFKNESELRLARPEGSC